MANIEKLYNQLLQSKNNFTWQKVKRLLTLIGYKEIQGAGSRVRFVNKDLTPRVINLHKPHPHNEIGHGCAKNLTETLKNLVEGANENDTNT